MFVMYIREMLVGMFQRVMPVRVGVFRARRNIFVSVKMMPVFVGVKMVVFCPVVGMAVPVAL